MYEICKKITIKKKKPAKKQKKIQIFSIHMMMMMIGNPGKKMTNFMFENFSLFFFKPKINTKKANKKNHL